MAKAITPGRPAEAQPRVRRGYFESRYGQLHVHNAIPPGGGFEEGISLLCLHKLPRTGRLFERFLTLAGRDRSVYAPDIPGSGDSDPPDPRASVADYAAALGDFLDSMRFREIDVLGYQAGALIATELAIVRPKQIRRVVLVSLPVTTEADRGTLRRSAAPPTEDGSHLAAQWRRTRAQYGAQASLDVVAGAFADQLRADAQRVMGVGAAMQYPLRERLGLITQPTLVVRPMDRYWESSQQAREMLPRGRLVDLVDQGEDVFETAPETVMTALKEFLRS